VLLLKALRERQPETDRLFGTLSGTTRILNFYSSANLLRLAVAGCSEPGRAARAA
jgi:50S ribosomal subunit-associated GTPase HflX